MSLAFILAWAVQLFLSYRQAVVDREININYTIDNLSPVLKTSLWNYETEDVQTLSQAFLRNQYITAVTIRDDKNDIISEIGTIEPLRSFQKVERNLTVKAVKEGVVYSYELWYEAAQEDKHIGAVLLGSDHKVIIDQLKPLALFSALFHIALLVTCASLFYFIQKWVVSQPVRELTYAIKNIKASQLETQEFHDRLLHRDDELGELFRSFETMQINLAERDRQLLDYQKTLERRVEERTNALKDTNKNLEESVHQLKLAQKELVESEKLASLGSLVTGVAHEVNTPLGVSITAITHLNAEIEKVDDDLASGALKKSSLDAFMAEAKESSKILLDNLMRAAQLVKSFKQVAVDQSSEDIRKISLASYLEEVLRSLQPKLKKTRVELDYEYEQDFVIETYPGALAQIATNLVMNALMHAFNDGDTAGLIHIEVNHVGNVIQILFQDDGAGMTEETRHKVFDPFFTTRRGDGGSGLGLNIVYNLVVKKLGGKIECHSELGKGTSFVIEIPYMEKA